MPQVLAQIEQMVRPGRCRLVATVNPEFVMHARRDAAFRAVLESAELCLADGAGVVWALRRAGCALPSRVTGTDLVPELAGLCARRGLRLFLLGAREGVAEEAARRLVATNPGLVVAGCHPGTPDPSGDEEALGLLAAARPDVLLVAYGHPKQEFWIARLQDRLPATVAVGVGGAFDFLAGRVPRAPRWMQTANLEWLYRLVRQPWRFRRMAVLPIYALLVLRGR